MKVKSMAKKLLAAALIIAVFAVALPLSLLTASADNTLPTPETIGGTDYSDKIWFGSDSLLMDRYESLVNGTEGSFNTLTGVANGTFSPNGFAADTTLAEGVGVVSYKFKFNGNFQFSDANGEVQPTYGNLGIKLGTFTNTKGEARTVYVVFRRCQSTIFLMTNYGEAIGNALGSNADTASTVEDIRITVKYDKAANTVSVWTNDTFLNTLNLNDLTDFALAENFGEIWNYNPGSIGGKTNTMDVTEAKAYGTLLKSAGVQFVPTRGNKTDLTSQLTLSDETLNAAWKSTGKITIPKGVDSTYTFNGITLNEGDTIYASFAFTQYASAGTDDIAVGTTSYLWAKNGSTYGYTGPRSAYNQFLSSDRFSFVAGNAPNLNGDTSKAGNEGAVIIFTKYVVDTGALEVWANYKPFGKSWNLYKVGTYTVPNDQYIFGIHSPATSSVDTVVEYVQYWKDTTERTYFQDAADVYRSVGENGNVGALYAGNTYNMSNEYAGNYRFEGINIDLSGEKSFTMEGTVNVPSLKASESRVAFVPVIADGNPIMASVQWNSSNANEGFPFIWTSYDNATATDANYNIRYDCTNGITFKMKVVTTATSVELYVNDALVLTKDLTGFTNVEPILMVYLRRTYATVSDMKIWGDALSTDKKNLTYKVVEGGNALYTTPATRYEVDNFGKFTANKSFSAIASNVDFSSTSNLTLKATVSIDSFEHNGDGGTYQNTVFVPRFIVGQYIRDDGKIGYLEYYVHRNWLHAALATEEHSTVAVQTDIKGNAGDTPYGFSFASWTKEPTLGTAYNFEATIANGKLSIKLNGVSAIADYDLSQLDGFTPVLGAGALLDGDFGAGWNEKEMVGLNNKATVAVITSFSTNDSYKTVTPYTDENGNKAFASGYNGGFVNITVAPANGFALKAGSLKLGDKNVINAVKTDTTGLTYDIESANAAIAAEFVTGNDAMTGAVLGTQYREADGTKAAAVRFLTRFYVNGLSDQNVQTENGIAVGNRTITDYGVLAARSEDLNAELTMENKSYSASGINNYIYSYTENYVEIAVAVIPNTDDTEYTLRGYIEFSDGTIVYTEAFTGTFAAAKAAAGK